MQKSPVLEDGNFAISIKKKVEIYNFKNLNSIKTKDFVEKRENDLKVLLKDLCDNLDHCLIYESGSLRKKTIEALAEEEFRLVEVPFRPTAENFAWYFYEEVKNAGFPVHRVEVYETPANCAAYE